MKKTVLFCSVPFLTTTTSYMCWTSIRSTNCIFSKCTYIYRMYVYMPVTRERNVGDARWTLNMWSGKNFCMEDGVWDIEMMMMIPLTLNIVHEALLRRMRIGKFSVVAILTLGNRSFFLSHIFILFFENKGGRIVRRWRSKHKQASLLGKIFSWRSFTAKCLDRIVCMLSEKYFTLENLVVLGH